MDVRAISVNDPHAIADRPLPPHGLMGLLEPKSWDWLMWGLPLLLLVLVLLGLAVWYWLRKEADARKQAEQRLLQQQHYLALKNLPWPKSTAEQEEFVYLMGLHLRRAMTQLTQVKFTDMTFRELKQYFQSKHRAKPLPVDSASLLDFFELAEQIKFQGRRIPEDDLRRCFEAVLDWVDCLTIELERQLVERKRA